MGPSTNEFKSGCNQTLIWETAFACPEDSSGVTAAGDQCSIRDPITGHLYDLRPLRADKSYTVNNTGRIFKVSSYCFKSFFNFQINDRSTSQNSYYIENYSNSLSVKVQPIFDDDL